MNESVYPGSELEIFRQAHNWKTYFSKHIKPFIHGNVLEVGAGIGATTSVLSSSNYDSWTCLEPDKQLAEELSSAVNKISSKGSFNIRTENISSIEKIDYYNTILYVDVLEHIEDDRGELELAVKLLSKNGVLVILSPAYQWLYSEFDQAIGHYRRYDKKTLAVNIPPALECVCLKYLDSVGALASLSNRILLHEAEPGIKQVLLWDRLMVPLSRLVDPLVFHSFGKSILGIWKK